MAEIVREATIIKQNKVEATGTQMIEYLTYFVFASLDILLAGRLILKLAGASSTSGFVRLIYSFSNIFIMPFEGIFRRGYTEGIETTSVLEPAVLVAIVVYSILAWGVIKLIRISSGEEQPANS